MPRIIFSLIIPVYKNAESLPDLLQALNDLYIKLDKKLEVIFVVDGSPDNSHAILANQLPQMLFLSTLLELSRNFGSFAAIRSGLEAAKGDYFAVMAADLQEPPELIETFFSVLKNDEADVVIGTRKQRNDPALSKLASQTFWFLYRKLIQKDIPAGGVDVFGCNRKFLSQLLSLNESHSNLVSLLFWLGYRRKFIPYARQTRQYGKSAWSLSKKLRYFSDSIFSFTDLPIRILMWLGGAGLIFSLFFAMFILAARIFNFITLPGYTTTLLILLFFTAFNAFCFGVIGSYVWRTFENSKARPLAIKMSQKSYNQED
jgi:glycosyltransferase involved in cell wall biosynthesis